MLPIPHESVKKFVYRFTGQNDATNTEAVKITNIIMSVVFLCFMVTAIFSFMSVAMEQKQYYDVEIELSGNVSIPYIDALENSTFDHIIIKGRAEMPVYRIKTFD